MFTLMPGLYGYSKDTFWSSPMDVTITNTPRAGESAEASAARSDAERAAYRERVERADAEAAAIAAARERLALRTGERIVEKPTNPKDMQGIKKAPMSCVSAPVLQEVALGMFEGAMKYGRHNYRVIGVRGSIYYDATMRHLMSWWEGEDLDPDSKVGLHHISKAIASLVVLRDAMICGKFTDDRPPCPPKGWEQPVNKAAEAILEKFPDPKAPYLQIRGD